MATTVRPVDRHGKLSLEDNMGMVIGAGRAVASKSEPGYITLTLWFTDKKFRTTEVIRVPINWLDALVEAGE